MVRLEFLFIETISTRPITSIRTILRVTLNGSSLKLGDKFTYLGCSISSTENDINMRLAKSWTDKNKLSVIWKTDLVDKIECNFFQAAVVCIRLYGCTTWTLTKGLEKKLDGNYTRMLRAILKKNHRRTNHKKDHPN